MSDLDLIYDALNNYINTVELERDNLKALRLKLEDDNQELTEKVQRDSTTIYELKQELARVRNEPCCQDHYEGHDCQCKGG